MARRRRCLGAGRGRSRGPGGVSRVPLEVRVVGSCQLACVLSAQMRGRWARHRPAFPASAPSLPTPGAPSAPGSELLQSSAPRAPQRLAAQILGREGPQLFRAAGWAPMGSRGSRCWNRLRQGRSRGERSRSQGVDWGFLLAAQGRVHLELDTSRPAQLVRDAKSMFQRPRAGSEACTLSWAQTIHRPVFPESPGARTRVPVSRVSKIGRAGSG